MDKYSHRERLQMILAGERPDRYAASFWRHFYDMEHHADGTVEAMVGFQKQFDWDFMKINPRGAINLMHVCSSDNYLEKFLGYDYRCQMYNWDSFDPSCLIIGPGCSMPPETPFDNLRVIRDRL